MARWVVGSIIHGVDPLSYVSFQPGSTTGVTKALNTFYLRLYGVRHMVKDHLDNERGNPLPPYGLLFSICSKGFFYASSHRQDKHIPWPLLHQSWSTNWNEK